MANSRLLEIGSRLVEQFDTRDPFIIAKELGIQIMNVDTLRRLKGAYNVIQGTRWIFLNGNLSEQKRKMVCAHEIGHDQLHRELAMNSGLAEYTLYDMQTRAEYEANIVAAEILLPDEEVLEYIYDYQYDVQQIAEALGSDINLIALKCMVLSQKGHDLRSVDHRSDFLK